ncbi:MAG: PDZ domain-containing protein [Maricaulaceae bacterium]
MIRNWLLGCAALGAVSTAIAQDDGTRLLRQPAVHGDTLVFVYGGDLWAAGLDGANPRRLTTHPADEREPHISPDGQYIAFTADVEENTDVYVVPTAGGPAQRMTWHPRDDRAVGWTPDGAVMIASTRGVNHGRSAQLFTQTPDQAVPEKRMEARFVQGDLHPDGRLAYLPTRIAYNGLYGGSAGWRNHRGGATVTLHILSADGETAQHIESDRINDIAPFWMGDTVYFLSDRDDESLALYTLEPDSETITKVHSEAPWDIRWADGHGDTIVFEAGGRLKTFDLKSGEVREIVVTLPGAGPQIAPRWVDASQTITSAALSPSAKRAVFTARGEVFTVPLDKGSTRNLTNTDGVREYTALWSPKGDRIAYLTDDGGVQKLAITDQRGFDAPEILTLGDDPLSFYALADWTTDGQRILYTDNFSNLFAIDLETGAQTKLSTDARPDDLQVATSPDGAWVAYTVERANFLRDLELYHFESGERVPVSRGQADLGSPVFSRDGQYLYFTASTNVGPVQVGLNMTSQERPRRYGIYAAVLAANGVSPLALDVGDEAVEDEDADAAETSDEETADTAADAEADDETNGKGDGDEDAVVVTVDAEGLSDRVVALPVPERAYDGLMVGEDGALYYIDYAQPGGETTPPGAEPVDNNDFIRFDFEERAASELLSGVQGATVSGDGTTVLLRMNGGFKFAQLGAELELKDVAVADMRAYVDPSHEWAQIFDEVWRMEAGYFYDPDLHGLDWAGVRTRYEPLLAYVARREDLNVLLAEMIGEFQVGHNRINGGDLYDQSGVAPGHLGADLSVDQERYRVDKIYRGAPWTPFVDAPLAAPGLGVEEGDYIVALNGSELTAGDNIYALLQNTAGEIVTLRVNDTPSLDGAREIVIRPSDNAGFLRLWDWVETNRAYVEAQTDGQLGYVYLPNTGGLGYAFFNRMYFAQADKAGLIFDERSNGGGQAADYFTNVLSPFRLSGWLDRVGTPYNTPAAAHYGPKAMLIDQDAGSGGDYLPYAFRARSIGPLIGTRTWGGLIGIFANPPLIDGGILTVPNFRFFTPEGEWRIENEGTAPDIEVRLDPVATNNGADNQLDYAIKAVSAAVETSNILATPLTPPATPTEVGR